MRANAVCHMLLAPSHADSVSFFVPTPSQCAIRNSPAPPTARQMPKMAGKGKCARRMTKCICEQPACLYHGPLDCWAGVHVLCLSSSCLFSSYRVLRSSPGLAPADKCLCQCAVPQPRAGKLPPSRDLRDDTNTFTMNKRVY